MPDTEPARTNIDLYRSVRRDKILNEHADTEVLYPSFEPETYTKSGREITRAPDVDLALHHGEVAADSGGTSLFDKKLPKVFIPKKWWFFWIPGGTVIDPALRIRFTGRNSVYDADHFQIEVASGTMTVDAFKGALDNFSRAAVVRACEIGGGGASS